MLGGNNTYVYVDSNPLGVIDPQGLTGTIVFPRPIVVPRPGIPPFPLDPVLPLPPFPNEGKLPNTDDCKASELNYCAAKCGGAHKVMGCYVSIKWKIRGIRGGEIIRSEERTPNCNCFDEDDIAYCPNSGQNGG